MKTPMQIIGKISRTPKYPPGEIRRLMAKLDLSEKGFALLMNVSDKTVLLWAKGAARPCGSARRLMQVYELCPEVAGKLAGADK